MTMSISPVAPASSSTSNGDYLSSLPPWRHFLSTLNWRPVADLKQRQLDAEKRIQQLKNDSEQVKKETEQLKKENARLAELNAKLAALWPSSSTASSQAKNHVNDCGP